VRVPKAALPQPRKIQITAGAAESGRTQPIIGGDQSRQASAKDTAPAGARQTK
jgi:hypothetical protein